MARRRFWDYCQARAPEFYKESRTHLVTFCDLLQQLYEGKLLKPDGTPYKKIIASMPPQHGKSRTLTNLCQWILGKNQEERFVTMSYNDDVAQDFAEYVRDGIGEHRVDKEQIVFADIFPGVYLKWGAKAKKKWALQGQHFNYLGVGLQGGVTSKGATIQICDDLISGVLVALNDEALDKVWKIYTGTFLSRVSAEEGDVIEIHVGTRWSKNDVQGRLLDMPEVKDEYYIFNLEAYDKETDKMLCSDFLGKARYLLLQKLMESGIFLANYHGQPIDEAGRLYKKFLTYDRLPRDEIGNLLIDRIGNYTDCADEGSDFLCSINYVELNKQAYIVDVLYTKDPQEITEVQLADMLVRSKVNIAKCESQAGGKGFFRAIEKLLKERGWNKTLLEWFHQTGNKRARIISNSGWVQKNIFFPVNWHVLWPEFYKAMVNHKKEGKNKHDDAADTITGVCEQVGGDWMEILK